MNNELPNETEIFAAMMAANPDLAKQSQAAAKQLQEEQSTTVQGNIHSVTITGTTPVNPISSGTVQSSPSNHSSNITDKIKALENKINSTKSVEPNRMGPDLYKDDYGQNTWYIKNESGMHVSLGDTMGITIRKGEVLDLQSRVPEDVILKSKDFMARIRNISGGLKRLTPEEYYVELQAQDEQNRKVQALETAKYLNSREGNITPQTIRPLIESQLNKLDLFYDKNPEISSKGMDPFIFVKWVMEEKFNVEEIDSMLGYHRVRSNTDITSTLIRKRHDLTK